MLGGIFILILTGFVSVIIIDHLKLKYDFINAGLLKRLFIYHSLLCIAYYVYVIFNPSDSKAYYFKVLYGFRGDTWGSFYGTSTKFIEFIGYPFVNYLGFSYEASMALFSFFGFLGFVYFYIFFKENIRFNHKILGFDLITVIFYLPNLHFWSSSFGKGSMIFLGLGLFFFGINKVQRRYLSIIIGGIIIYHVRPHVMLIVLVSSAIGFVFTTRGISIAWRTFFLAGAGLAFFFIYKDVLTLIGIDEGEFISQGMDLTHRASELSKATSGIDISSYSLPLQLFTFLYRPLFFDSPGILGFIVSFENVFYLFITLVMVLNANAIRFLFTGNFLVKSAFLSFLTISVALAQIAGNLGLAMRQKSQVMILFLFVVVSFLDQKRYQHLRASQLRKQRQAQIRALQNP